MSDDTPRVGPAFAILALIVFVFCMFKCGGSSPHKADVRAKAAAIKVAAEVAKDLAEETDVDDDTTVDDEPTDG
jgi:hypothetical protein